jgi:hypothetical protein
MKQQTLFPALHSRATNRTKNGELACAFGTPWLDHDTARIDHLTGCRGCDEATLRAVTHSSSGHKPPTKSPRAVPHPAPKA